MKTNISSRITSGQALRCHKSNARTKFSTRNLFQPLLGVISRQQRQNPVCSTFITTQLAKQSVQHSPSRCSGNVSWTSRLLQEHSSASSPRASGHGDLTAISLLTPQSTSEHRRGCTHRMDLVLLRAKKEFPESLAAQLFSQKLKGQCDFSKSQSWLREVIHHELNWNLAKKKKKA